MVKKVIGQVTVEEKNEIQVLFERRNGLNELAKILTADNNDLYEKLVKDLGETGMIRSIVEASAPNFSRGGTA